MALFQKDEKNKSGRHWISSHGHLQGVWKKYQNYQGKYVKLNKPLEDKTLQDIDEKRNSKQSSNQSSVVKKKHSQPTLPGIAAKKAKLESSSTLYKKITRKIAGMMIHDFQPYSFVEDKGFSELMQQLEPRYQIPHRTTFSRSVVPTMYKTS